MVDIDRVGGVLMRIKLVLILILVFSSTALADYRETFEKEFVNKPWVGSKVVEEGVCVDCHTSDVMKPDYLGIPQEWKMSIHYENKVSCHDCHGGNPSDSAVSCGTPHSGFVGIPKYKEVPKMCGKCHIGILKQFNDSKHGKALMTSGRGPNCVTCHGSHKIQKANMNIINKVRCTRCHSYKRAKIMKQALFMTEKRISDINHSIRQLRSSGASTEKAKKMLFRTEAGFRTLFHSVDVSLVKGRTAGFSRKLDVIEGMIADIYKEIRFRKNFSAFLFLLFASLAISAYFIQKNNKN
ncbi:hypothetical protein BMS3Abin07_00197 [bacterium BMS3Abin07]|nr:hypothetical protein BMS3Abin07_00197 [bacterium BMS3Abin07]GBE33445.1 hypothetical protein BMS3Bbin05_02386 [bacterium BMS3Bbin05]HDO22326.1 cytochrome C [Nitrospirota bacterium]HDZ88063.1 cytochrome C [Nitrospirota bacterium]